MRNINLAHKNDEKYHLIYNIKFTQNKYMSLTN